MTTTPTSPIHERLLREHIIDALFKLDDLPTVRALADSLVAGRRRIVAEFAADDNRQPIPRTLSYRVEVELGVEWIGLCRIHWSRLGLEWIDVTNELDNVLRQQRDGTYPHGPNDNGAH